MIWKPLSLSGNACAPEAGNGAIDLAVAVAAFGDIVNSDADPVSRSRCVFRPPFEG